VCFAVFFLQSCEIRSKQGIIISRLKGASKLSTVEVSMTKFVYSSEELRNLWDKIVGKDKIFLSKTQATLKLGVDLSRIQEKDIKIRGTRVELELPPVQVMNFSYPAEKFEVDKDISDFDLEKISRKNAYKLDKIYQSAELQIWEQIDEIGMHKTVEEKTEKLIRHILENLGFTEVYITFKARQPFKFNIGDPMIDSLML
jgi:hypothetical protein